MRGCDLIVAGEVIDTTVPAATNSSMAIGYARIRVSEVLYDRNQFYPRLKEIVIPMPYSGFSTDHELQHKKGDKAFWVLQHRGNLLIFTHPEQKLPLTDATRQQLLKLIIAMPKVVRLGEAEQSSAGDVLKAAPEK